MPSPLTRVGISLFIVWNVCTILLTNTNLPIDWRIQKIFRPYGLLTRIMQRWTLLCPEPRRFSKSFHFLITFKDGTKVTWQRPYPPNWSYFERQHSYNWQKFDLAGDTLENETIWPDIAQWVQRKFQNEANPPTIIQSYVSVAPVPPPFDHGYVQHDSKEFHYTDNLIFTYNVN